MYLRRLLKIIIRSILVILSMLTLYVVCALLVPYISVNSDVDDHGDISIYILTNGMHTDIVCPMSNEVMNWTMFLPSTDPRVPVTSMNYAAFGWGDKGFYLNTPTWADLKFSTAFRAAFGISESAMHVTYYRTMVEDEKCRKILISKENYKKLVSYIIKKFDIKGSKPILIPTDMVYGDHDAFYEANGSYHLFFTCNTWANSVLKIANQKAALWTATDRGIFRHYQAE